MKVQVKVPSHWSPTMFHTAGAFTSSALISGTFHFFFDSKSKDLHVDLIETV